MRKQKRYRLRQRAGIAVYHVRLSLEDIDTLVRLNHITEKECADRTRVGEAVAGIIRMLTGKPTRS
jgi:hypothetical protein